MATETASYAVEIMSWQLVYEKKNVAVIICGWELLIVAAKKAILSSFTESFHFG
jgi:hypothetical protein